MNSSSLFQTKTDVHNQQEMQQLGQKARAREQELLAGCSIFAQMILGCALYLYSHVSTPGYLSILMTGPVMAAILFLSLHLHKRSGGNILSIAGNIPGRLTAILLSLVFFLDAQVAAFGVSAILSDVLPHFSPLIMMLTVALMLSASLTGDQQALPRLSRLLRWPIFLALLISAAMALPHGSTRYLFPLLGQGIPSIFRGVLWMSGCTAGACCPMLLPGEDRFPLMGRKKSFLRLMLPLLPSAGYALLSACLLPFYALARPENLGFRLLLFTKISGSAIAWSLLLMGMLFLLLMAISAGAQRSAALISFAAGKKKPKKWLILSNLLLIVPVSALKTLPVQQALLYLAPFRGAVVLGVLLLLWIVSLCKGKEAQA